MSNYSAAWNTCSYMYRTLVNGYGIPKSHIFPLMADGTDPGTDTHNLENGTFYSQNLDLDGDGNDEIEYAATKANINSVFTTLYDVMQDGDQLFFFGMDHGGASNDTAYMCLWAPGTTWHSSLSKIQNNILTDNELVSYIQPLLAKGVVCNGVFGQCHSGGFVTKMNEAGCVAASAASITESSWVSPDGRYAEFLYHWITALNIDISGSNMNNGVLTGDAGRNGICSMEEAFNYAKIHDVYRKGIENKETPQYTSIPFYLGKELGLNRIPLREDAFIRDNFNDYGDESITSTGDVWHSPSLTCNYSSYRLGLSHDPVIDASDTQQYVHVKINNRGWKNFPSGKKVKVYWTAATLGLGSTATQNSKIWGTVGIADIPELAVGDSITLNFPWTRPNVESSAKINSHIGFYAILEPSTIDPRLSAVSANNNSALNLEFEIPNTKAANWSKVYITNPTSEARSFNIFFPPSENSPRILYDDAQVEVKMDYNLYNVWVNGGGEGIDLQVHPSESKAVIMKGEKSAIKNLVLNPGTTYSIMLRNMYQTIPLIQTRTYSNELLLKDDSDEIKGGVLLTFNHQPKFQVAMTPS